MRSSIKKYIKRSGIYRRLLRGINASLIKYSFDSYSQNGEDGIIQEIFYRLGINSGYLVEFGASDGLSCSNTVNVIKNSSRFMAVYIECDKGKYDQLKDNLKDLSRQLILFNGYVEETGANSLDSYLERTPANVDLELLSIDIDGMDYQIWSSLKKYRPKVVIIEINSNYPINERRINGKDGSSGSSFSSMLDLGIRKGYSLVCFTGNMIFVRDDLIVKLNLPDGYVNNPGMFKFKGRK